MKVLFLAALVVSISANWLDAGSQWYQSGDGPFHPEYRSGKEYIYDYESQVLTSLPTFTKSHGGIKIIAKVKFDFTSAKDVVMQLTGSRILSLNHEINTPSDLPPVMQLTTDHFTPLPSSQMKLIQPRLELPIKLRYDNGKVTFIEVVSNKETNWSINLKRSILSMLQIRLQADSTSTTPNLAYNQLSEDNSTAFDILEPALDGNCYSGISVQRVNNTAEANHYKVLKTRDPNNCLKVNSMYKFVRPQTIDNCDCDPNMNSRDCVCKPTAEEYMNSNPAYFNAKTLVKYDIISTDKTNLLIKSCAQSATYRYEFPNHPDQYLATFSNQSMQYVQEKATLSIDTKSYSWRTVNQPWRQQTLKHEEEVPMMSNQQIKQTVQHYIDELETISSQKSQFDRHIPTFVQLVESMKVCSKDQLESIYHDNNVNTAYRKWKLMVDGLAHCNTTICDEFLMDKIASGGERSFPYSDATSIFMLWAANKVPTVTVLDKFSGTVVPALKKHNTEQQKIAYYHSLLCFGSMVRRYVQSEEMKIILCVRDADKNRHRQNIRDARKYEKTLEGTLINSDDDEGKIALLKALTNLGSLESLPQLQRLMSKKESNAVRVHAIHGVRNLCFQNRQKVLQTLVPLLMDVTEDSGVRMAAFIYYLKSNPSTTQLHKVIEQTQDLDLKTVFVQILKNELRANGPKQVPRRQKAKLVLSKVKAFQMSPESYSRQVQYALRPDSDGTVETFTWLTQQTPTTLSTASIKLDSVVRGTSHHSVQLAFRAEGLGMIWKQLSQLSHNDKSSLDMSRVKHLLQNPSGANSQGQVNPSLTLSILTSGQEISVIHVDKHSISRYLLQALQTGEISIPIKVFQTYMAPQEQNQKLQPNGMWLISETATTGVIDFEGILKITKPTGDSAIPDATFVSDKMLRYEECTAITQFVKCGFAHTGVTSAVRTSRVLNNQYWTVHFSIENRNVTFNFSNPGQDIMEVEMDAMTYTFYTPHRLPVVSMENRRAMQEIKTDDPDRLVFKKEVEAFRSVDLQCEVEGDVYAPELYNFIRDRMSLLPSVFSMKKQHVKLTVRPHTTSPRNYTVTAALIPIANEMASLISENSPSSQYPGNVEERTNEDGSPSFIDQFKNLFSNSDIASQQSSEEPEQQFGRLSVGSIQYIWQGRISSITSRQNLTMLANVLVQYDYEHPSVHYLMDCERPPIPGKENEHSVSKIVATKTFNPSINQMVSQYNFTWGPKSNPFRHEIQVADELTPIYKDNTCYEQSVYGCKDEFGVFYPVWYNQTSLFTSKNTDLVATIMRYATPYNMNSAKMVLARPVNSGVMPENEINMTRIFRPYSEMVDVAYTLDHVYYNMSQVYAPFQCMVKKMWYNMPDYPLSDVRPVERFVPGHHRRNPFFSRDSCVVDNTKIFSMDSKQLASPKSNCEVNLLSDCSKQQSKLAVTLKSQSSHNKVESKVVKTKIEQNEIEVAVSRPRFSGEPSISLTINKQKKSLSGQKQFLVKQQHDQKTVAIVECTDTQCEIKSSPHGLYVRVNIDRVKVENGQASSMCGLCSAQPEVYTDKVDYQTSVKLFKDSRVQGSEECSVEESQQDADQYTQQNTCTPLRKHKIVSHISKSNKNQLQTCVTTSVHPLCSRYCQHKNIRVEVVPARCVSREQAQRVDLFPTMEGNEMYLEDSRILTKLQSAESVDVKVPISNGCE